LYPKPMLSRIEPSVDKLIEHVEKNSTYKAPAADSGHSPSKSDSHSSDSHGTKEGGE
jgi:hypothetical protein